MTNSYQPSSSTNHILMERAITDTDGLPSLSLPISATIDGAQHGYNSFPIEAQTHGPTRMFADRTRSCVTREPNVKHSSDNSNNDSMESAYGGAPASSHRYIPSVNDVDINFVRPFAPASQLARYPPKKNIFAGDSTEQSHHHSESSSSSRAAPYHLPPIQVTGSSTSDDISRSNRNSSGSSSISSSSSGSSGRHPAVSSSVLAGAVADPKHLYRQQFYHPSNRMLAEPMVMARAFYHQHHTLSSNNSPIQLSSLAPSFSRETNRSMSEYLLHCAADQQEKQLAGSSNIVRNNGSTSNNTWPKSWDRETFSSQADKSPGIIIDDRLGDDDDDNGSVDKEKKHFQRINYNSNSTSSLMTGVSDHGHHRHNQPPPTESLKHLVSPHAIRKAEQEEQEEAMGGQPEHPFLAFPSFMSMKHLHEDQIKAYYHRTSPRPCFSIPASESPSPSSSISFSPLSGQASAHTQQQQQQQRSTLRDTHHSHRSHSSSLVIEHSPQLEHHQQEQQPPPAKARERLKRPPNAYLLFNRDMRRKLLETSPKMTVAEISKEIGERWKELPKGQRQLYISQAATIKQDHLQNHPDFIYTRRSKAEIAEARKNMTKYRKFAKTIPPAGGLRAISPEPPADPDAVDKVIVTTTHDKRGRQRRRQGAKNVPRDPRGRKKKRHRHPTAPKHPMSGFLFYLSAVRPQIAQTLPGSTVGPISKIIARQWRDMTDQERIPWLEKAEQDKARYAQEMQSYMARLEVKGDDDLTLVNKKVPESDQQQQQQQQQHSTSSSYDINQNRVIFMHSLES